MIGSKSDLVVMPTELTTRIKAAFADTPSPGTENDDISATKYDDEGVVDYFRGTTWRGHRVEDLRRHEVAMSFFTDKAFRYWLPAFMLAELENPIEADIIGEGIVFHLTKGSGANARLREFAQDELEAVASFCDECAQRDDDSGYREAARAVRAHIQKA
jgi:hypothetical protein